jgi:hypothetical protein
MKAWNFRDSLLILSPCGILREEFWIGFPAINTVVFKAINQSCYMDCMESFETMVKQ